MSINPGSMLSQYRLVEKLGEGGMGVVWKAEDTILGRQVAIKVLPTEVADDADRLVRFRQEARLLASLNHPNIAAIFGLEEAEGIRFLVLELVPGQTLARRLRGGPLPLDEALPAGRQMAEALETAHEQGIIHRDLKPGNVMVTPDGRVKILDFGLAKGLDPGTRRQDMSHSPTLTSPATGAGVMLGTAAYMSPEQARGKPLDRRTDIWSFGCVLYEALTGRQAFEGETISDCLARILEREPDWSRLGDATPPGIRDLLHRCLRKDPARRLRDIGDARIEIEDALAGHRTDGDTGGNGVGTSRRRSPAGGLAIVAAAGVLIGALVTWALAHRTAPRPEGGLAIRSVARITHDPGLSEWPTWSPDGSLLAFASSRGGDFDIYVRRVDGGQEVNVTGHPGQDFQPAISPDGNQIAFVSTRSSRTGMVKIGATFGLEFRTFGGDLWLAPALGGRARRLAPDANFPAWHPDGDRIAYVSGPEDRRSIVEVSPDGGEARTVLDSEDSHWEIVRIHYSPGGRWISFEDVSGQVMLIPVDGGAAREMLASSSHSHVWDARGGRLLYLSRELLGGTRLLAVGLDERSGRLTGAPRSFGLMTGLLRDLALTRDGRDLALTELEASLNLTLLPLTPAGDGPAGPEEVVSSGQVIDRYPAVSPDGSRIAYASDRLGPMEIWILETGSGRRERLELPGEDEGASLPYWSPDGDRIAVTRFHGGGTLRSLWLAAVDGSQAEELIPPDPSFEGGPFSPDGRRILYGMKAEGVDQIFTFDVETRTSRQVTTSPGDKNPGADWSPDGRWITFTSSVSGAVQVWRIPAGGGDEERVTVGEERIRHAFFSPDGRWLYYQPSHRNVYRMPAGGGPSQPITTFPEAGLFMEEPSLSPDGTFLAYCRSNGESSLWRLTLHDE